MVLLQYPLLLLITTIINFTTTIIIIAIVIVATIIIIALVAKVAIITIIIAIVFLSDVNFEDLFFYYRVTIIRVAKFSFNATNLTKNLCFTNYS